MGGSTTGTQTTTAQGTGTQTQQGSSTQPSNPIQIQGQGLGPGGPGANPGGGGGGNPGGPGGPGGPQGGPPGPPGNPPNPPAPPINLPPVPLEIAVNKPETFDGNRAKTEAFIAQCLLVFAAQPDRYQHDIAKKAFMLSYMNKGNAAKWALRKLKDPNYLTQTFLDFTREVEEAFRQLDKTSIAAEIVTCLKQGRSSVDRYTANITHQSTGPLTGFT